MFFNLLEIQSSHWWEVIVTRTIKNNESRKVIESFLCCGVADLTNLCFPYTIHNA